jgi:hypothetical protein
MKRFGISAMLLSVIALFFSSCASQDEMGQSDSARSSVPGEKTSSDSSVSPAGMGTGAKVSW